MKKENPVVFLRRYTKEYYSENNVFLPGDFPLREFAAQLWHGKGYIRHMSFHNRSSVQRFLVERAPKHFYYSSARYDQPGLDDMDAKGWRSADIIFDIDADHIPGCEERMVKLRNTKGEEASFIDEKCITLSAMHAVVLYDILVEELGFNRDSISVEFSGHRGFHLTIYLSDNVEEAKAGQEYRRELVNYIRGLGVSDTVFKPWLGLQKKRRAVLQPVPPLVDMAGLRGRLARVALRLARRRREYAVLTKMLTSKTPRDAAMLYNTYRSIADELLEEAHKLLYPEIDVQVTVDTKRLIRAPESINGKTMLKVARVRVERLEEFQMDENLSPFHNRDPIRVVIDIERSANIEVLGHRLRLRPGEKPKLPAPVALYLIAKGVAVPLI